MQVPNHLCFNYKSLALTKCLGGNRKMIYLREYFLQLENSVLTDHFRVRQTISPVKFALFKGINCPP